MYDKSIAETFRIYRLTIAANTGPVSFLSLLDATQREDYDLITNEKIPAIRSIEGRPHQSYKRVVVDGYILSPDDLRIYHNAATSDYEDTVPGVHYTFPVYFWTEQVFIENTNGLDVDFVTRIFFS